MKLEISNRRFERAVRLVALAAAALLFAPAPALAYGDVGSGILIWQLLLASFAGAMFYVRKLLRGRRGGDKTPTPPEPPKEE